MDTTQALIEAQRIATIGTLLAAFIGGTIGFLGSWIATTINSKAERKRLLLQLGFDMGMKQWDSMFDHLQKLTNKGASGVITPPYIYVNFNVQVLGLLVDGKLTPESLAKLDAENQKVIDVITKKQPK